MRTFFINIFCSDGTDFVSTLHQVEFYPFGESESTSSRACITILDDGIAEAAESFSCEILIPSELDGIVVKDPNTIIFTICDDDSTYCIYYVYVWYTCCMKSPHPYLLLKTDQFLRLAIFAPLLAVAFTLYVKAIESNAAYIYIYIYNIYIYACIYFNKLSEQIEIATTQ